MPYNNVPESMWDKMDSCVLQVQDQGHDKQSAIAICHAAIVEGKAFPSEITVDLTSAKAGARNSANDKQHIREIRSCAKKIIEHTMNMEPSDDDMTPEQKLQRFISGKTVIGNIEYREVVIFTGAVKAIGDWVLEVLGVPYGGPDNGKDTQGEYFSPKTKTYSDQFHEIPAFYFHGLDPSGKPMREPVQIGKATYEKTDSRGLWYRVVLDKTNEYAKRMWDAAKSGIARASSGSIAHLVRVATDGEILSWPVAEMTLVDAADGRRPVNAFAIATPYMKALYELSGMNMPELEINPDQPQPGAKGEGDSRNAAKATDIKTRIKNEVNEMDENEVKKIVADTIASALKADRDAQATAMKAQADEQAKIDAAVKAERSKWEADAAKARRLPFNGQAPTVTQYSDTGKYDHLSTAELGLMIDVQTDMHAKEPNKIQSVSPSAMKALMLKVARVENDHVSPETASYVKSALKARIESELTDEAIKAATDPMYTGGSTYGSDWVGTAYSNQIWEKVRADVQVVAKIPSVTIPDGYSSEYFPFEGADPTWYKVPEASTMDATLKIPAATVTSSQSVTGTKQISIGKMGARTMYTGELDEDSLINFAPQLRKQLEMSGSEMMEHVVIDGDTATSSNINDIGGTTYSGATTTLFLLTNGLRKVGIANGRSAAGGLSEDDYLSTIMLLGANGISADVNKCGFIVGPNTYFKSLKLSTVKTKDVWTNPTLENGKLTSMWGYNITRSFFMHYRSTVRKANTAGKIDLDTTANNAYGAILAVRWDQWKLAYKRRMTMETTRIANADSWEIVALTRWGLGYRDAYAAAETYYVGV